MVCLGLYSNISLSLQVFLFLYSTKISRTSDFNHRLLFSHHNFLLKILFPSSQNLLISTGKLVFRLTFPFPALNKQIPSASPGLSHEPHDQHLYFPGRHPSVKSSFLPGTQQDQISQEIPVSALLHYWTCSLWTLNPKDLGDVSGEYKKRQGVLPPPLSPLSHPLLIQQQMTCFHCWHTGGNSSNIVLDIIFQLSFALPNTIPAWVFLTLQLGSLCAGAQP